MFLAAEGTWLGRFQLGLFWEVRCCLSLSLSSVLRNHLESASMESVFLLSEQYRFVGFYVLACMYVNASYTEGKVIVFPIKTVGSGN